MSDNGNGQTQPKTRARLDKVKDLLVEGKTPKEICAELNITRQAFSVAKRQLDKLTVIKDGQNAICSSVAFEKSHALVVKNLNTIQQLEKINSAVNEVLDTNLAFVREDGTDKVPNDLVLRASAEIREHLRLQNDLYKTLNDFRAQQAFKDEVLEVMEKYDKGIRNKIIEDLKEKRLLHASVEFVKR